MSYAVICAQNSEFIADFDSHDEAVERNGDFPRAMALW